MINDWQWLTRSQAAEVIGCGSRNFDDRVRSRLPAEASRGKGKHLRYDVRIVVKVWCELQAAQISSDDPLLSGPSDSSDNLELYRYEKYVEQKRKNDEAAKVICDSTKIMSGMSRGIHAARTVSETLKRKFGNDAADLYNQGIDALVRAASEAVAETNETS